MSGQGSDFRTQPMITESCLALIQFGRSICIVPFYNKAIQSALQEREGHWETISKKYTAV